MEKIKQLLNKVKSTFRKICDTIKKIKSNYDFYKGLWDKPQSKVALKNVKKQSWYLLKKLKPKKIQGDVVFGTGDPASTGQTVGMIGTIYGIIPEKLHITPDFEQKVYEGNLFIKGKFRCIHAVIIAIKLIADKNIRYVIKKIQSKEEINNE